MDTVRKMYKESGLTLQQLGLLMGYEERHARKCAWKFLQTKDPHLSTLKRFAGAMSITVQTLIKKFYP